MNPAWTSTGLVVVVAVAVLPRPQRVRRPGGPDTAGPGRPTAWPDRWLAGGLVGGLVDRVRASPHRFDAALPAALDEIVRSLTSGATLPRALGEAGRAGGATGLVAADLAAVADELDAGASIGEALERWRHRRPGTHVGLVTAAVDLAVMAGGEPAALLAGVADSLRDDQAVAAEARALATQARASAAVVALAPLAFAVLTAPFRSGGLIGSGAVVWLAVAGLSLDAVGLWWMWRLTGGPG